MSLAQAARSPIERVNVTIYTDPGCPFGFNAQRQAAQLAWHYGKGLAISRRMIISGPAAARRSP